MRSRHCDGGGIIVGLHPGKSDINLARQAFVSFLNDEEMAVADFGYRGKMSLIKLQT